MKSLFRTLLCCLWAQAPFPPLLDADELLAGPGPVFYAPAPKVRPDPLGCLGKAFRDSPRQQHHALAAAHVDHHQATLPLDVAQVDRDVREVYLALDVLRAFGTGMH